MIDTFILFQLKPVIPTFPVPPAKPDGNSIKNCQNH
jgi:hypothetical protein